MRQSFLPIDHFTSGPQGLLPELCQHSLFKNLNIFNFTFYCLDRYYVSWFKFRSVKGSLLPLTAESESLCSCNSASTAKLLPIRIYPFPVLPAMCKNILSGFSVFIRPCLEMCPLHGCQNLSKMHI